MLYCIVLYCTVLCCVALRCVVSDRITLHCDYQLSSIRLTTGDGCLLWSYLMKTKNALKIWVHTSVTEIELCLPVLDYFQWEEKNLSQLCDWRDANSCDWVSGFSAPSNSQRSFYYLAIVVNPVTRVSLIPHMPKSQITLLFALFSALLGKAG